MHSMTTRRKLTAGLQDEETPAMSGKRLRPVTNVEKGKEKATSAAANFSEGSSAKSTSKSTQSTRTPRGPTHMDRLAVRRVQGIRKEVEYDKYNRPLGPIASEMQSYIGVIVRQKVSITYSSWKQVPDDVKELIWESINLVFIVRPCSKILCLKSANEKWKQFKSLLTTRFVFGRCHDPQLLNTPPHEYAIPQADWSQFVISRMSEDFKKQSKQQRDRSQQNKYLHRLSRKGYAKLEQDMADEFSEDAEVNRALLWKKGRVNKEGDYEGDDLKETIQKIDDCIQMKNEGKMKLKGVKEDVLTVALNSKEHAGRVRGVGGHVTPTIYFNVPIGNTALKSELFIAQHKELMEERAKNSEQDKRIEKLEAAVFKMGACHLESDEKGSCSVRPEPLIKEDEIKLEENLSTDEEIEDDDVMFINTADALQGKLVTLTVESGTNVAAYGTIVSINGDNELLHGAPLPNNCVRVAIDHAVDKEAPLPFPIPGECDRIADAIGTHVAWPVHLISLQAKKPSKKMVGPKKELTLHSSSMPRSLYMLYCYCKVALEDGRGIELNLDCDVFCNNLMINVSLYDIIPFCQLKPISYNCIVVYICYLYKKMKKENKEGKFRFVDPHALGHIPGKRQDKKWLQEQMEKRARALADRLIGTSVGQLCLVPVNVGFHWILTVIDPNNEEVYLFDPLSHRNRDEEWKLAVNLALKFFNVEQRKNGRKQPLWEVIKAPLQPDGDQCGYFVMRYMRQIIEEYTIGDKAPLRSIFTKKEYPREEIDEVRKEWSKCLQDYIEE